MDDAIGAPGVIGLFMYFVIATASVWLYRSEVPRSVRRLLHTGILPLVGALFMTVIFFYGLRIQRGAGAGRQSPTWW